MNYTLDNHEFKTYASCVISADQRLIINPLVGFEQALEITLIRRFTLAVGRIYIVVSTNFCDKIIYLMR